MASWQFYNKFKNKQLHGGRSQDGSSAIDFGSATAVKLIIVITGANIGGNGAPTSGTNLGDSGLSVVNDLVPGTNEVSGTNYTRTSFGSMTVSAPSSGVVTVSGTSITFAQSGAGFANGRYLVLADVSTGVDSTSPLICAADLGATFGNVAGALTINTDTGNAIFTLT